MSTATRDDLPWDWESQQIWPDEAPPLWHHIMREAINALHLKDSPEKEFAARILLHMATHVNNSVSVLCAELPPRNEFLAMSQAARRHFAEPDNSQETLRLWQEYEAFVEHEDDSADESADDS
jgi:hypothetical protein